MTALILESFIFSLRPIFTQLMGNWIIKKFFFAKSVGIDPNVIPKDKWGIAKITCHKNADGTWAQPTTIIDKACETGQTCTQTGQNATCNNCNNNETCDSGENWQTCPDCPKPEM